MGKRAALKIPATKWQPIKTLPDSVLDLKEKYGADHLFLFNECNGPDYVWGMQIDFWSERESGVWTHWAPVTYESPKGAK